MIHYLLHGYLSPSPTFLIILFLATSFLTLLSVSCFLHRSQSHRTIVFAKPISHFFRFVLWFFTGMSTKEWVAVHRKHHATVDTPEDPHSPRYFGLMTILLKGADIYRMAGRDEKILLEYGSDTPDDWIENNLYGKWKNLGVYITLAIEIFLFGAPAIILWAGQMLVIPTMAAGYINGIAHVIGYQRYKDGQVGKDGRVFKRIGDAKNVPTFGLVVGEEFHNNHHAYQERYKFSHAWYEFDLAGTLIEVLEMVGLAYVPSRPQSLS